MREAEKEAENAIFKKPGCTIAAYIMPYRK